MLSILQPLPTAGPVMTSIPPELFGDAVMVLEFLNTFGKLFNIDEVIRGGITFGMLGRIISFFTSQNACT